MNKHKNKNQSGGFHIAKMIPFEVLAYGAIVLLMPIIGVFWAITTALVLTYATYSVFRAVRAVVRQVPTALGYGDVAVSETKKVAIKTKSATQTATATVNAKAAI